MNYVAVVEHLALFPRDQQKQIFIVESKGLIEGSLPSSEPDSRVLLEFVEICCP